MVSDWALTPAYSAHTRHVVSPAQFIFSGAESWRLIGRGT